MNRSAMGHAPRYHSFLLRCWSEGPGVWRFSVEDPHTGQRRGFTDMAALTAFLEATLLEATLCEASDEGMASHKDRW